VRVLLVLTVVVVFAALMILDTAALIRVAAICVSGGCGVPTMWIVLAACGLTAAVLISRRFPRGNVKTTKARKKGPPRAKARTQRKPRQAKSKSA
jgi:hypothetical protein